LSGFAVTFLTRHGCLVCDEAEPVVTRETDRRGLSLTVIDVDRDDQLRALYGDRVPVVLGPGGEVIAEGRIDRRRLRKALGQVKE
jgi:hypothetical protein